MGRIVHVDERALVERGRPVQAPGPELDVAGPVGGGAHLVLLQPYRGVGRFDRTGWAGAGPAGVGRRTLARREGAVKHRLRCRASR